jgi:hypothetical protein
MKRLGMTLILTGVLSLPALAGDIPTIGKASPSPSPTPTTQSTNTSGIGTTILLAVLSLIR